MCASEVRAGRSLKKDWASSPEAFGRFLNWLDAGVESEGECYVEMRRRLVAYFDRKRCAAPDELADETLTRVSRRLEEEGAITNTPPAQYCYIVARYVFLEYLRSADHRRVDIQPGAIVTPGTSTVALEQTSREARQADCLDRCLGALSDDDRSLILAYYSGEDRQRIAHRRALALERCLTPNALTIRASRLRSRLEACVTGCLEEA